MYYQQSAAAFDATTYGGPRKIIVPNSGGVPVERQMTDAEKLKADKEQLKLK